MDNISASKLAEVHPILSAKIYALEEMLIADFRLKVSEGLRSWTHQSELWFQGRNAEGLVICAFPFVLRAASGNVGAGKGRYPLLLSEE